MKALTVLQPFAGLIACGEKTIETRTWPTKYRGRLLICAGKRPHGLWKGADFAALAATAPYRDHAAPFALGVTMCIANLVDCRPMTAADEDAAACTLYPSAYSWVLENVLPVRQIPVRGQLGLWQPTAEMQAVVREAFYENPK